MGLVGRVSSMGLVDYFREATAGVYSPLLNHDILSQKI